MVEVVEVVEMVEVVEVVDVVEVVELVKIDCAKSMKLETSPKVTKSKRSLHWCRSISNKNTCAFFITVSVKKLLHYRAGGLLQYRAFYYIIGRFLLHYRARISIRYYSIGRLLHYRLVQAPFCAACRMSAAPVRDGYAPSATSCGIYTEEFMTLCALHNDNTVAYPKL